MEKCCRDMRVARSEEMNRMRLAIDELPSAQQEAITLHHLHGMTLAEVADRMGKTPAAIAGLIHRGLRALQKSVSTIE
jgi:RNA polymerase sigma-70 factor, ECF subfamily